MTREINQMPVKTWNWLKVNGASVDVPDNMDAAEPIEIHAASSGEVSELPFVFEADGKTEGSVEISVDPDANHTVVMDFKSESGGSGDGFASVTTRISLAKKAKLTLVQVHRLGEAFRFVNRIDADVDEKADFHLLHVFIRGCEIYADLHSDLRARKSSLRVDTAYLTTGKHVLDINYEAAHIGESSMSDISVMGVMCEESIKRFRGTIDFRHGAVGAKGNEIENVLLLDEGVINQTVPIILCEEEDVEGNHGATIGRLDEDMLYYMQSRGLDEDSIREMLKTAYLDALLRKAPAEASAMIEKIREEENL
ncbi:MAG: SufD family Fe-S cluster assembly protein [Eubacterium sp.]|nr:SufD family Fe-S cluster assembly protein [Eubacterium sp.]